MMMTRWMAICLWVLVSSATLHAADEITLFEQGLATEPVAHEKPPIEYPHNAQSAGIEGWLVVEFTVDTDGSTSDVVIRSRSIDGIFEDAAQRSVSNWTYDPATLDGEPVATRHQTRMIYAMSGQKDAVSNGFARQATFIGHSLSRDKLEKAWKQIGKLDGRRQRTLAETCYVDFWKAEYYRRSGDLEKAAEHFDRALVIADVAVSPAVHEHMLRSAIEFDAKVNHVGAALASYDELIEVTGKLPDDDPARQLAARLEQLRDSNEPIELAASLEPCEYCKKPGQLAWHHTLARSRFSFGEVPASIDEVEVWCDEHSVTFAAQPGKTYSLANAAESGECSLSVYGDAPDSFAFSELSSVN